MHDLIEELVVDGTTRDLPVLTPRLIPLACLPGKADAIVGMRRSGKTWRLFQKMRELVQSGVPRQDLLYVNFEDERLVGMGVEHLHLFPESFYAYEPERMERTCWIFLHEIHCAPGATPIPSSLV